MPSGSQETEANPQQEANRSDCSDAIRQEVGGGQIIITTKQSIETMVMACSISGIRFGPQVCGEHFKSPCHGRDVITIACWTIYEYVLHAKY